MSGLPLLDWPALTLSIFNAFILCWLGFTVLLEADRRAWGVWLSAEGLLLGAIFFIAHTAILRSGWDWNNPLINFWWRAGWWPLILSPFAWYCVILWYSGFWDNAESSLHHRQASWFGLVLVITVVLLAWMALANPLPDLDDQMGTFAGFYGLAIAFPVYILLCILLSLDAILRPGPTAHFMGNEARRIARPWLTASTLVLLLVCFLVAFALIWGINTFEAGYRNQVFSPSILLPLTELDVIIEVLITIAILLIGQAAMVYEVFSSIPLPRSGLRKRWSFAIVTGALLACVLSSVFLFFTQPELAYLVLIPLITGMLTIQNHLSVKDQIIQTEQLRRLARPQQIYESIFSNSQQDVPSSNGLEEFAWICTDLIQAEKIILLPSGVLKSFLPDIVIFPEQSAKNTPPIPAEWVDETTQPKALVPENCDGFYWAIPLVSRRGLDGWLFLGKHTNHGFYTKEDIEIARSAVERWMDNQSAAEIARRLVSLQQESRISSRLLDQKARRILHDDILPLLHTALISDSKSPAAIQITEAHHQISQLLREAPPPPPPEIAAHGLFTAIRQIANSEAELLHADLNVDVDPQAEQAAASLSADAAEAVYHAVRESLRNIQKHTYLPEDERLKIKITSKADGLLFIQIENNGTDRYDNKSVTDGGQGIKLHNAMLAEFGGGMRLENPSDRIARVTIVIPVRMVD